MQGALFVLAVACGDGGSRPPGDAGGGDAGPDREAEAPDLGGDAPPASPCQRNEDCGGGRFCGAASRSCLAAAVEVVAGRDHTCSRHADGAVRCWGLAESIRAGGAAILGPTVIAQAAGARALAAGVHTTCAITSARQVRCWGNRELTLEREAAGGATPLGEVSALALGAGFGCAANAQGTWCWGKNTFGQLARPLDISESDLAVLAHPEPAQFLTAGIAVLVYEPMERVCGWGQNATKMITASDGDGVYTTAQCRPGIEDVVQLVAGDTHACLLDDVGAFVCWGERYYGALGIGGTDTADVGPPGTSTSLDRPVLQLSAGVSHTCARTVDQTVRCFGRNHLGQIGPAVAGATEEEIRQPTAVGGFAGPVVELGGGSTAHHSCAILADGSVQCWGANATGQLGDGARIIDATRKSPAPVTVAF